MDRWRPTASVEAWRARSLLLARIRDFFSERAVVEVETPLLSGAGNSDPGVDQFSIGAESRKWLRTSPEYSMKRMLAAGAGDIYELGRVFRRGEAGRMHNPEFTMLEWYRVGWSYRDLMAEAAELVSACGKSFGKNWTPRTLTCRELYRAALDVDPHTASADLLAGLASEHGLDVNDPGALDADQWLDLLLSQALQPSLPADAITLLHEYPASQAALARIRPGDPPVAERFELFLGRVELANGYQELTDPVEQKRRFEAENQRRAADGRRIAPLDENLLAAMHHGLPECAGVALGVDRLLMACLGLDSIADVIAFPTDRA